MAFVLNPGDPRNVPGSIEVWTENNGIGTVDQLRRVPGGPADVIFQAEQTATTNQATLLTQASNAIAANVAYLAIGAPSNAQVVAQVDRLTREVQALIRLATRVLDSTSGT
jgi:hypothetical protein